MVSLYTGEKGGEKKKKSIWYESAMSCIRCKCKMFVDVYVRIHVFAVPICTQHTYICTCSPMYSVIYLVYPAIHWSQHPNPTSLGFFMSCQYFGGNKIVGPRTSAEHLHIWILGVGSTSASATMLQKLCFRNFASGTKNTCFGNNASATT